MNADRDTDKHRKDTKDKKKKSKDKERQIVRSGNSTYVVSTAPVAHGFRR